MPAQTFLLLDLVAHPASSRLLFTGKTRYKNYLVTCLFNKAKKVTIVITKTVAKVIRRFAASPAANWDFDPQISLFRGGEPELLSNTMLLGTISVSTPNGVSFRPMALAGCTSVTGIHTDRQTYRPRYWCVCRNKRRYRLQRCRLIIIVG